MSEQKQVYRLKLRLFGFEPQMQYTTGMTGKKFWTPLNHAGYWLEPQSFSYGVVTKRIVMSLKDARLAIQRARLINSNGRVARSA